MTDTFRSINLLLAIIVFLWLGYRRFNHPEWFPRGGLRRDIWVMAFCWDLTLIVGSVEQLLDYNTNIRIGFAMAAVLTTLAILLRPAEDWSSQDLKKTHKRPSR